MPGHARCDVCGGPLRVDNTYGICNRTIKCRRKRAIAKTSRYPERSAKNSRDYIENNRDLLNAKDRAKYAAQKHEAVTYFAWSPGLRLIKIGMTTGLKIRFKALRNGCPDVICLATIPIGRKLEKYLHAEFADSVVHGEWFNLGDSSDQVLSIVTDKVQAYKND